MIERRSGEINGERYAALDCLFRDGLPSLEVLIEALLVLIKVQGGNVFVVRRRRPVTNI